MKYGVLVTTCDKHLWTMRPFAYLFNKYWSEQQEVYVLGESYPPFSLPQNFHFISAGVPWPKEKYSNGVMSFLQSPRFPARIFIWLLDDYWLVRTVDHGGISTLIDLMTESVELLRIDLTSDRMCAGGAKDVGYYGHYDIVEAKGSPYQMSLQPGIWDKTVLSRIMRPNWSPWDVELTGTGVLNEMPNIRVIGTRQMPIRYTNGLKNERKEVCTTGMREEDLKVLKDMQWLP